MFKVDRTRKLSTLAVTCVGFFMVLLDASIVTVALPTIQASLHASLADLQWVVDAYTLPFAVLLLSAGTLGDRFGRKRLFLTGLVIFTAGSAVCGFAPTLPWLIAGRVLQGAGGAALSPGSLSVLASAFSDPRERAQAIGIWSGVSGTALAAGPLIGGLLIQWSGWQAIFFVNLPIGAVALVFGLRVLGESRNPSARRLDLPGQALAIAGLTALTYALIEGQSRSWGSALIVSLFAASGVLLVTFVAVEARAREPMLPLGLFANGTFSTANLAALATGFALLGTVFFVSQYFQAIQGFSALQSGERTLPTTIGIFVMGPIAGRITARVGPRLPVTLGALAGGSALLLYTRITPTTSYGALWWNLLLFGVGIGLMLSPITTAVLGATPPERAGLASSMVNTSRQIGSVLGVAVLGAVVESGEASNITSHLRALRVPPGIASTIGETIATAGAQAARLLTGARLPISPQVVRDVVLRSFTEALHPAFVTSACLLLATAVLVWLFLDRAPRPTPAARQAETPVTVDALALAESEELAQ